MVACAHDSIPDSLLLHSDEPEPNTPVSATPSTATGPTQSPTSPPQSPPQGPGAAQQGSGRPNLGRTGSRHWEMGPNGISRVSSGQRLSRLSPLRGLGRPQQAPGPEGMPQEGPQVPTATTQAAPQASGLETRLSRRTSTKLHWKPLDMSVSSDAVEIVSPFNKAGPEKH